MATRTWKGRVFIATSLDGFIARPDGDINWLVNPPPPPPGQEHLSPTPPENHTVDTIEENMKRVDCIVMGRKSYEKLIELGEWPYTKPTYVVSSTLAGTSHEAKLPPAVRLLKSVDEAADVLGREQMKCVYVDGGLIIQEFLRRGWIDEMIVTQTPDLLGSGIPLFGGLYKDIRLTLLGVEVIENGMVSVWYRVVQ